MRARFESITFVGPLPPPRMLAEYGEIVADAPERLLRMTEREQTNRHWLERRLVSHETMNSRIGLCFGFALVLLVVGLGAWLAATGRDVLGFAAMITPIATIAGVFVFSARRRAADKRKPDPPARERP